MRHINAFISVMVLTILCSVASGDDSAGELGPLLSHEVDIGSGQIVRVFDDVLSIDECKNLMRYMTEYEIHREFMHKDYDPLDKSNGWLSGETPWVAHLNKSVVESFASWKRAESVLETTLNKQVKLRHAQGEFLHSLDVKPLMNGHHCKSGLYIASIFVTTSWRHNDYGQVSFYAQYGEPNVSVMKRPESVYTVHPKPGRMVVWPSCTTHAFHPPSVNRLDNLMTIRMWFSAGNSLEEEQMPNFDEISSRKLKYTRLSEFTFSNPDAGRQIDHKAHFKRTFYDTSERGIYVFDGLYTTEELTQLSDILFNIGDTGVNQFDTDSLEDHDNVQWIKMFNISEFLETPIWNRVLDLAQHVSGQDGWYPYDVALNHVRSSDHTRIHPDADPYQLEYTYLLYLTDGVGPNEMGETVWFEQRKQGHDGIHRFTGPGGEEFEPIAAVRPKYGRVVIFRNVIEHSARPPSMHFHGCRYSFAVKVSRTKRAALCKQLYEIMETLDDMSDKMKVLNNELMRGVHDDENGSPYTTEALEQMLHKLQSRATKYHETMHQRLVSQLQTGNSL